MKHLLTEVRIWDLVILKPPVIILRDSHLKRTKKSRVNILETIHHSQLNMLDYVILKRKKLTNTTKIKKDQQRLIKIRVNYIFIQILPIYHYNFFASTNHNMNLFQTDLRRKHILRSVATLFCFTNSCSKKYRCIVAMYLLSILAQKHSISIERIIGA